MGYASDILPSYLSGKKLKSHLNKSTLIQEIYDLLKDDDQKDDDPSVPPPAPLTA
jgi:hypothetical protein